MDENSENRKDLPKLPCMPNRAYTTVLLTGPSIFDLLTIHIVKGGARNPVYYMKVNQTLQKGSINFCDCDENM